MLLPTMLCIAYAVSECAISLSRRAKRNATVQDRGSLALLWVVISLAIAGGFYVARAVPTMALPFRPALSIVGSMLLIAGMAWRWYAIYFLGRWFTVNVAIAADQPLIDDGPYRYARHPSYSGALLALLGFALCLGNALALLVILLPILGVFLRRIQVEEQALAKAFGARWELYCARTKRLLPGVY